MAFRVSKPVLATGQFKTNVDMGAFIVEASAIPIGWTGPISTNDGLSPLGITWKGSLAEVSGGHMAPDESVTFVVVAQTMALLTPEMEVVVSWGEEGGLDVTPLSLQVKEPTTIVWVVKGADCNIVSLMGLPRLDFESPFSYKREDNSNLSWRVRDHCRTKGAFFYSLLVERRGEVRYIDPKITNIPTGSTSK